MTREPNFFQNLQDELSDGRAWLDRTIVLSYAVAAGLSVVIFTLMSETCFEWFGMLYAKAPWAILVWTPAITALTVWGTRSFVPGAAGSGIPQVMTALDPQLPRDSRHRFISLRLTLGKMLLGSMSLLAGLSAGREGPSVQVAAGVMHDARRWLRRGSGMSDHALLVAGGAAGIAAAFNAPLAGVVFAIEELSNKLESRNSGLIIAAIVLAGVVSVAAFGNLTYFGSVQVPTLGWRALFPSLVVMLTCGVLGGLFSRLLAASLAGMPDRVSAFRKRFPVRFAAVCGLAIAVIGLVSGGATFGAGGEEVRNMLAGHSDVSRLYVLLKFVATWLTTWSGVPGGIFAPSLSIGAGIGHDIAQLVVGHTGNELAPSLIAIGMAGFLAATTQAPLTSFIIVMEMINGRPMVLSLMASAMIASLISRLISRPLYGTLSSLMLRPTRERERKAQRKAQATASAAVSEPAAPEVVEEPPAPVEPPPQTTAEPATVADTGSEASTTEDRVTPPQAPLAPAVPEQRSLLDDAAASEDDKTSPPDTAEKPIDPNSRPD